MTGEFVGEIKNIIWPNWHSFKFPYLGMSIKLKSERFKRFSVVFRMVKAHLLDGYSWNRVL